jgi:hypothetical protein
MLNCWGLYGGCGEIGFSRVKNPGEWEVIDRIYMIYKMGKS